MERGHSSRWCEDLVAEDVHDVKNILRHLGILRGKSHIHGKPPIEVSPVIYEDAPVSGCWYPAKQPGETFKEGEVLGRICDYFDVNCLYTEPKWVVLFFIRPSVCAL
ncbi:MAG: succinylglutamate desuccinylase/aspartoacylase family protein [Clostridia bacterium]